VGIFTLLDRVAGDSKLVNDWRKLGTAGYGGYDYGKTLTDEGLTSLRDQNALYKQRLNDPLGSVGRSIFTRARGNLADDYTRTVNSGAARRSQLALQTGGTLTAEQIAALDAQDRRDANEGLFRGETDLSTQEAGMTLTETGKLFDRMENVDKTIVGVGQDERTRGLQAVIASMLGRTDRMKAIWGDVVAGFGAASSYGK